MQPPKPSFSDLYTHQHPHYYSHFPTQNPNPYPYPHHHHLQLESHLIGARTDPDPPGVDPYLRSYSISHTGGDYNAHHAGGDYNAHHAGGLTYPHAFGASVPNAYAADLVAHSWAADGNTNISYAVGATIPQDVSQQLLPVIPTQTTWTNPVPTVQPRGPWKKIPKKTKVVQSVWCEICKIECNTKDVLYKHKLGKKHIKNVEKLNSAASVAATTSTTTTNPVIGPVENPKKGSSGNKKKAGTPQDLEMKRRRVLEGGAAANAVRTCVICNVVCNSDAVFRFHLAGQKHASMLKKSQQAGAV